MYILGISSFYHDSAACLLHNGEIIAALQEERFTRIKHDPAFPSNAITKCLQIAGIQLHEVTHVVFYEKPFVKFERIIQTYFEVAPKGFVSFAKAMPIWLKEKLFLKNTILKSLKAIDPKFDAKKKDALLFTDHHRSHAASAYYPSPFNEALVITMDGVGEWNTTTICIGKEEKIEKKLQIDFPHSIGLLYSAFTYFLGFKVNSGEYKVMGLAPYGNPIYVDLIEKELIDIKEDGSFRLNLKYFNYLTGLKMTSKRFSKLFGINRRNEESPLLQVHTDISASIQQVTEKLVLNIAKYANKKYPHKNLCLSGGVALNCVANGLLMEQNLFENIWIQPASGDAGGALGAAYDVYYNFCENKRIQSTNDHMKGAFLGNEYSNEEIQSSIAASGLKALKLEQPELINKTAELLGNENVIGWFQGKMEFGPRALGNRSILGIAEKVKMRSIINQKIKFRESFRPFAPIMLVEEFRKYFNADYTSEYMLLTAKINKEYRISEVKRSLESINSSSSVLPAVTHLDYSARIQTVNEETNPLMTELLLKSKQLNGNGILVNTSFNVRGEPIVESPKDAINCFIETNMDYLVIGSFIISRKENKLADVNFRTDLILD